MKKIFTILSLLIMLFPALVLAKTAPIDNAIEQVNTGLQKANTVIDEGMSKVEEFKKQIATARDNTIGAAMEQVNAVKDQVNEVKDQAMEEVNAVKDQAMEKVNDAKSAAMDKAERNIQSLQEKADAKGTKTGKFFAKSLGSIGAKLDQGSQPTAEAMEEIDSVYTFPENAKDDAVARAEFNRQINDEAIKNISGMYGRATVKRYKMENTELETLVKERKDNATVQGARNIISKVVKTRMRADRRWIYIMQSMADMQMVEMSVAKSKLGQEDASEDDEEQGGAK